MRNVVLFLVGLIMLVCCSPNTDKKVCTKWELIPDSIALYKAALEYPDSIKTTFVRNSVFEDSIIAYKCGFIKDSIGNTCPAYVFQAAVGDMWIYNSKGVFVEFIESELLHSDSGHKYNP